MSGSRSCASLSESLFSEVNRTINALLTRRLEMRTARKIPMITATRATRLPISTVVNLL